MIRMGWPTSTRDVPLAACAACGDRCVASTLEDGRCRACVATNRRPAPAGLFPLEDLESNPHVAQTALELPQTSDG